jgi:tetratricopeptide (TPR) repeat protein
MHTLAFTCARGGQFERAVALSRQRLELSRQLADVRDEGVSLGVLGDAYYGMGLYEEAIRALSAALAIFRDHANRRFHGLCLLKLGYSYQAIGQHRRAIGCLNNSLTIFRELDLPFYEDQAREALTAPGSLTLPDSGETRRLLSSDVPVAAGPTKRTQRHTDNG